MTHVAIRPFLLASLLVSTWATGPVSAAEKTAADLLPASTAVYVELSQPAKTIEVILNHPLRQRIEGLPQYRQWQESKEAVGLQLVVAALEQRLGQKWHETLTTLTSGGAAAAVDATSGGAVLLVKSQDAEVLTKVRDSLIRLAKNELKRQGNDDPIAEREYRGATVYQAGPALLATRGAWLVATNRKELGREVIDNLLDGAQAPLSGDKTFQTARKTVRDKPAAWGFVNVARLRDAGVAEKAFSGRSDNPLGEVLVGGLLGTLGKTPYATASLYIEPQRLGLALAMPHEQQWVTEARHYYFGASGDGAAPPVLRPKQSLFSLAAYRDLSAMWRGASDLLDEKANADLAKADSNLSTLFSGRDFGRDILGALGPRMQLVLARQEFDPQQAPVPAIKLPSGALVFELKDPQQSQRVLRVTYQSLIGFLNVVGAMNGQPQFELDSERRGEARLSTATYLPDDDKSKHPAAAINYNFSPSVAFVKNRFVIASTSQLARELTDLIAGEKPAGANKPAAKTNTDVRLNVRVLAKVLGDNQGQLVAQNMLQKGHTKSEAEKEIGTLLELVSWVREVSLRLTPEKKALRLELDVNFAAP